MFLESSDASLYRQVYTTKQFRNDVTVCTYSLPLEEGGCAIKKMLRQGGQNISDHPSSEEGNRSSFYDFIGQSALDNLNSHALRIFDMESRVDILKRRQSTLLQHLRHCVLVE
jgi:hypothetical protein